MKTFIKILGIIICSLILLAILIIGGVFLFKKQISNYYLNRKIELLKQVKPFTDEGGESFKYTYPNNKTWADSIKTFFQLDTLFCKDSSTWSNSLRIAKFVSENIKHANQKVYPKESNSIYLWKYHKNIEPNFNCRLHSIMLQELLSSCGIICKYITCMPKDSTDTDCHVINTIWVPEMNKWVMLDSDTNAYITNDKGIPLSIDEIRESIINNKPLKIVSYLNNKIYPYYIQYLAKNFYWFITWKNNNYNKETKLSSKDTEIVLMPPGYNLKRKSFKCNTIITNNKKIFWQKP